MELTVADEKLIKKVLDVAFIVHKELGAGLYETIYEKALIYELNQCGLKVLSQTEVPLIYKGQDLKAAFRADIIIEDSLLLELKCVEKLLPVHMSQVITYLKLLSFKRGLLINFNNVLLKDGLKRVSI